MVELNRRILEALGIVTDKYRDETELSKIQNEHFLYMFTQICIRKSVFVYILKGNIYDLYQIQR